MTGLEMFWFTAYTLTGISYVELIAWAVKMKTGQQLNWLVKMILFVLWPLLFLISILGSIFDRD